MCLRSRFQFLYTSVKSKHRRDPYQKIYLNICSFHINTMKPVYDDHLKWSLLAGCYYTQWEKLFKGYKIVVLIERWFSYTGGCYTRFHFNVFERSAIYVYTHHAIWVILRYTNSWCLWTEISRIEKSIDMKNVQYPRNAQSRISRERRKYI